MEDKRHPRLREALGDLPLSVHSAVPSPAYAWHDWQFLAAQRRLCHWQTQAQCGRLCGSRDAGGVVKRQLEETMQREGINCPELAPPVAPFSHLVKTEGFLYLSRQVSQDPATGSFTEGDIATQTARIMANIQAVLKSVDRDLRHVVKTTVFLTDMADYSGQCENPYLCWVWADS
jgi:enamine deaminase RidA (YjgF/YER057c/UK114 family)